jgi:threonine dehydrogenase-like Zn-dependent dehydrogenase
VSGIVVSPETCLEEPAIKTVGTFLVNDPHRAIRFGEVELVNPPRRERRGLDPKAGIRCTTVVTGFCGSDWELMQMGRRNELGPKFPAGQSRLINGHEGVVWVREQNRYAIVLIRGGDARDPSRFEADETFFEYGCDQADGLMSREGFFHPDMLLTIPPEHLPPGSTLSRQLAARLVFADPMACMIFQRERCEDLLAGHNWRLHAQDVRMATNNSLPVRVAMPPREAAMDEAIREGFARVVIYGLGTTGLLGAIAIQARYPHARIVTVGRSRPGGPKHAFLAKLCPGIRYVQAGEDPARTAAEVVAALGGRRPKLFIAASGSDIESQVAFKHGLLDNNGIYASFTVGPAVRYETMPFGFRNHLIYGAINFCRQHMEEAIALLPRLPLDELVGEVPLADLQADPVKLYDDIYRSQTRPMKTTCVWDAGRIQ